MERAAAPPANAIVTPIQGTITAVRVEPGQQVESGQVVFILEAMKMENEIVAPKQGKIGEVRVKQGDTIESGAIMATFAE
jgi:acetyl-CoA/propionyl-CoA carboxylase biotin carboxyl carrier protein